MKTFKSEIQNHLVRQIIPFWQNLKDETFGGYYGYMDYNLKLEPSYEKGCILNSRILWFFSQAYLLLNEKTLLDNARHAYRFLKNHCLDQEYGGVFWSVTYDGKIQDDTKHTYNQAFAIYALSSYYEASGDKEALTLAENLFELIEEKCKDEYGYLEAFNRQFLPQENDKLSENGIIAEKTMNTLLHMLEAYTELYRVSHKPDVAKQIRFILDIVADKVYNPNLGRQEVFFDQYWNSLIDLYSYGHDIETSWLVDRALEVLDEDVYTQKLAPITAQIAKNIYDRAYHDHSLWNEAENGVVDTTRVWWVQAETVVGFWNAYEKNPVHEEYKEAAVAVWQYIREYLIDKREGSEWFWGLDKNRKPLEKPIVEPWKCPYHNGRMCIEIIRRLQNVT